MSSRYDSRTTTFSPEGRLYQVEYAVEAISHAGTAIGILTSEGVVLATEKRAQNALLDIEHVEDQNISGEKVFKVSDTICCAVAGITSDANALVRFARQCAHQHEYTFQEPLATEDLCRYLCDQMQGYTQYGGMRPFGVSFLVAGWDRYHGFQLYHTDPSGNYNAWKAFAAGQNEQTAQGLLRQEWNATLTLRQGLLLALKVLGKTMDSANLTAERVELATLSKPASAQSAVSPLLTPAISHPPIRPAQFTILTAQAMKPFLEEADRIRLAEEDAEMAQDNRL